MSNEWKPENIYQVLSDDRVRQILLVTNEAKRSAQDIADICDGSLSSIYRRLEILTEYGLLQKEIRIDQDGHHHNVYEADFESIAFQINDSALEVSIDFGTTVETYTEQWPSLNR